MISRRFRGLAAALLLAASLCGLAACGSSEAEAAKGVVVRQMDAYVALGGADAKKDENLPDPAFRDDATSDALESYGMDVGEYRAHLFKNFSYEVGRASSDGDSATVDVTVTNESLDAAADAAAADYDAWAETDDAQAAYSDLGHQSLFEKLMGFLYARLDANESPKTTEVEVHLSKSDSGEWAIDYDDSYFDALY